MGQVPDDLKDIPAVAAEVDALRERTQSLVGELERRLRARAARARDLVDRGRGTLERLRHAVDLRAQLEAHPRAAITVGTATLIALGLGVYFTIARRRQMQRPLNRLRSRASAYRALLTEPERVLRRPPSMGQRVIAAVLIAGASTIVRGLTMLLIKRSTQPQPRQLPPAQTM
jgi:hypothetical protein